RIKDDTVSDDAGFLWVDKANRDLVKDVFDPINDCRVTGVRTALKPNNRIVSLRQEVNDLRFAFVAPMSANRHGDCHGSPLFENVLTSLTQKSDPAALGQLGP
ncbi:MAG: hypothetical protein RBS49_10720, partial [Sphaerochaeta sp.]|nr:hypothetical protein [Sphaerochaeta sp.]